VFIESESGSESIKIVYFDSQGRPIEGKYGVPGGGYVIFNAPEGFATISLLAARQPEGQAVTVLNEQSVVSVVNHSLK
jgi:hypothetical protein